jgi:predicted secreted protein
MKPRIVGPVIAALAVIMAVGPVAAGVTGSAIQQLTAAAPAPVTISSGIAPGVQNGLTGFGSSSVLVPAGEKVTFLAQTQPPLPGRRIEIWTIAPGADWRLTTARLAAADGSIHYVTSVADWVGIQARFPGDAFNMPASSHGRIARATFNGLTGFSVTCDEFEAAAGHSVARSLVLRSGELVSVTLCSNASTGFAWQAPVFPAGSVRVVASRARPAAVPLPGAAGSQQFIFQVMRTGTIPISLAYSQPWAGGIKAAWRLSLGVVVPRPAGFSCAASAHLDATSAPEPVAPLTAVRVGAHPGYDRIVFEFAGTGTPAFELNRAQPPFVADGSGLPVAVRGRAFLRLVMRGASGAQSYTGPGSFLPADPALTALVRTGDFEGVLAWVAGTTSQACFRISTLDAPARIVVDLRAP